MRLRAERLRRRRRLRSHGSAGGGAVPRARRRGAIGDHDSAGGQGRALLQRLCQHGPPPRRSRRRRPGALQPLRLSGHRSRRAAGRAPPGAQPPVESRLPLMWIALLRGRLATSLAATSGVHGPDEVIKLLLVGADVTMTASGALPERAGAPDHVARGPPNLDGGTRVRIGRTDEGQHEPGALPGARRLRTGQLHEDADVVRTPVVRTLRNPLPPGEDGERSEPGEGTRSSTGARRRWVTSGTATGPGAGASTPARHRG